MKDYTLSEVEKFCNETHCWTCGGEDEGCPFESLDFISLKKYIHKWELYKSTNTRLHKLRELFPRLKEGSNEFGLPYILESSCPEEWDTEFVCPDPEEEENVCEACAERYWFAEIEVPRCDRATAAYSCPVCTSLNKYSYNYIEEVSDEELGDYEVHYCPRCGRKLR